MDYLSLIKQPISTEIADFIELFNQSLSNYNVSVREVDGKVIFLRKLERGGSEHFFRASLTNDAYGETVTLEAGNKSYTQVFYLQGNEALDNFEHLWQKQYLSAVVFFWNEQQGVMQAIRVPFKM